MSPSPSVVERAVPQRRVRLGWLGPAIVLLGVLAAAAGIIFMIVARPAAGTEIHSLRVNDKDTLVVRAESGGERNFVELRREGRTVWQSIVPTYAGRADAPGIAWNDVAVSVRIIRNGRAEIFALSMASGSKLGGFGLAPALGEVVPQTAGPVTLTDHVRSYELVAGAGWHHLVAFDLTTGQALWSHDLGATAISAGRIEGGMVTLVQGAATRRFDGATGIEQPPAS